MRKRKTLGEIVLECLTEIYLHATPPRDLQDVIDSGEGKKSDWFLAYSIPEADFEVIMDKYIKKYHLKGGDLEGFKTNLYLGPSPRFT